MKGGWGEKVRRRGSEVGGDKSKRGRKEVGRGCKERQRRLRAKGEEGLEEEGGRRRAGREGADIEKEQRC